MRLNLLAVGVVAQLLCCLRLTHPSPGLNPFQDLMEREFSAQRLDECFCEVSVCVFRLAGPPLIDLCCNAVIHS